MDDVDVGAMAGQMRPPQSPLTRFLKRNLRLQSAEVLLRYDRRPPIVYLRSFTADEVLAGRPSLFARLRHVGPSSEFEEDIVENLRRLGPVVAAARPAFSSPAYATLNAKYGEPFERTDRLGNTWLEWRVNGKLMHGLSVPLASLGARRAFLRSDQWQPTVSDWPRLQMTNQHTSSTNSSDIGRGIGTSSFVAIGSGSIGHCQRRWGLPCLR
jgi:hypothetical protein